MSIQAVSNGGTIIRRSCAYEISSIAYLCNESHKVKVTRIERQLNEIRVMFRIILQPSSCSCGKLRGGDWELGAFISAVQETNNVQYNWWRLWDND